MESGNRKIFKIKKILTLIMLLEIVLIFIFDINIKSSLNNKIKNELVEIKKIDNNIRLIKKIDKKIKNI